MKILDAGRKDLDAYALPGGYPIMYLARDGWRGDDGTLYLNPHRREEFVCCPTCARDTEARPDLIIVARWVHYEGPSAYCEWCNTFIESAYRDPEEEEKG